MLTSYEIFTKYYIHRSSLNENIPKTCSQKNLRTADSRLLAAAVRNFIPFRCLRTSDSGENVKLIPPPKATRKDLIILKKTLKYLSEKTAAARQNLQEKIENIKILKLEYETEKIARQANGKLVFTEKKEQNLKEFAEREGLD